MSFATDAGSNNVPNEDAVAATSQVVVVVDGVSAPKNLPTGCIHGTSWYARSLASQIVASVSRASKVDLQLALDEALRGVAASHVDTCDLSCDGTPSATVAVLCENAERIDYLVLSDAVIAIEDSSSVGVIADKRVEQLLGSLIDATKAVPVGSPEHEERLIKLVSEQRKLRNVQGGYWLAGAIPEAAEHAIVGSVAAENIHCAAVMTDGAASLVDLYQAMSWKDALKEFASEHPYKWIERVREIEIADSDAVRWPRYKTSDDATLALCTFSR
ncbi:hypothetical protein [Streptosporangium sp. NPDC020145]|uniref:hypothetical protein n=1 Tax=Streptosporangium sp. NPDC020145 TaxID=3154694 RepID=UPI003430E978